MVFGWRDGTPIDDTADDVDDLHDKDYDPGEANKSDSSDGDDSYRPDHQEADNN